MNTDNENKNIKYKDPKHANSIAEETFLSLQEFRRLKAQKMVSLEFTTELSVQVSSAFLNHYLTTGKYLREAITLLCEIATLEDEELAKPGLKGIFPLLVERLSDSFNPQYCVLYDRAFAQVVEFCRHLPAGKALDAQLNRFGLMNEQSLLMRKQELKKWRGKFNTNRKGRVRKVFVLSRVTVGAEVAITSIIMAKLKDFFQNAELVLLADSRMSQLFGGDPRVRVREIQYERNGGLIDRLNSWLDVVEILHDEGKGLGSEEFLVVDPDSRLTQLGILPVVADDRSYLFFESRGYTKPGIGCIGQLTANWLNENFGKDIELFPYVSLLSEDRTFSQQLCQNLRRDSEGWLVSTSFGVGGNLRKRVPDPFEEKLILNLIDDGCLVILDKGVGKEERARANQLVSGLRKRGKIVTEVNETNARYMLQSDTIPCQVATWEGGIGAFSSLIAETDEYIGYDSAGQHIAAALGTPAIDVFADTRYPLFAERWKPYGKGVIKVVKLDSTLSIQTEQIHEKFLSAVMACHQEIRNTQAKKETR